MKECIEREEALTEFEKVCDVCMALVARPHCGECSIADTVRKVKRIPAADVVAVVRCSECKFSYDSLDGRCCSYGVCVDCVVCDDFFCAYGARMGGDGE